MISEGSVYVCVPCLGYLPVGAIDIDRYLHYKGIAKIRVQGDYTLISFLHLVFL